jgi:uncharacterized protein (DUF362 family)
MSFYSRRNFIKASVAGGIGATLIRPFDTFASFGTTQQFSSEVALTTGDNRADMALRALKPFSKQIAQAIGKKRVVLKPNNVSIDIPLCATHVDTLEGILEFMKSIGKVDQCIIAESAAGGATMEGFSNYGYMKLINKYPVKLVDLDSEKIETLYVFDEKDFKPHAVRVSGILLDPDSYIVSVARMKTHDRVLATLSLKNIVLGAPVKDIGFSWSPSKKPGTVNDKPIVHGGGYRGLNYNLYALSRQLHPHLAVIDGFEGMEGNGPNRGTPVDHRVCVAGLDWLATDRIGIELMGIDFAKVGYLNYCAQTGLGTADLNKIKIIGESIEAHRKTYKLSDNIDKQLVWMNTV